MPKYQHIVVGGIGLGLMLCAVLWDGHLQVADLRVSAAMAVFAAVVLRMGRQDGDARYQIGYHDGHRDGYNDGRKVRSTVIPLPTERLCRRNTQPSGRHSARCRDDCAAQPAKEDGQATLDDAG